MGQKIWARTKADWKICAETSGAEVEALLELEPPLLKKSGSGLKSGTATSRTLPPLPLEKFTIARMKAEQVKLYWRSPHSRWIKGVAGPVPIQKLGAGGGGGGQSA